MTGAQCLAWGMVCSASPGDAGLHQGVLAEHLDTLHRAPHPKLLPEVPFSYNQDKLGRDF